MLKVEHMHCKPWYWALKGHGKKSSVNRAAGAEIHGLGACGIHSGEQTSLSVPNAVVLTSTFESEGGRAAWKPGLEV